MSLDLGSGVSFRRATPAPLSVSFVAFSCWINLNAAPVGLSKVIISVEDAFGFLTIFTTPAGVGASSDTAGIVPIVFTPGIWYFVGITFLDSTTQPTFFWAQEGTELQSAVIAGGPSFGASPQVFLGVSPTIPAAGADCLLACLKVWMTPTVTSTLPQSFRNEMRTSWPCHVNTIHSVLPFESSFGSHIDRGPTRFRNDYVLNGGTPAYSTTMPPSVLLKPPGLFSKWLPDEIPIPPIVVDIPRPIPATTSGGGGWAGVHVDPWENLPPASSEPPNPDYIYDDGADYDEIPIFPIVHWTEPQEPKKPYEQETEFVAARKTDTSIAPRPLVAPIVNRAFPVLLPITTKHSWWTNPKQIANAIQTIRFLKWLWKD